MISLTLCLYIAAGVVIGTLTAFAAHNQRTGWKKSRTTLAEALDDLYADLGLNVGPSVEQTEAPHRHLALARTEEYLVDPVDFSDQLFRLNHSLGEAAAVGSSEPGAREHQMVPVKTKQ